MFAKEIYVSRRNALKKAVGSGVLLFLGNDEAAMNYADNQYRFRQDSTFLYFFDFHVNAGVAAVIDIDNDRETVFGDEATIDDIVWSGKLQSIHDTAAEVGVEETLPCPKLREVLREALAKGRKIHFLPTYRSEQVLKIQDLLGLSPAEQVNAKSLEFVKAVIGLRLRKQPEEIAEIDAATTISMQMHLNAMRFAREGMKEYEVMSEVHRTALAAGGDLSFPIICTTHGETLHQHRFFGQLDKGGMVLVDAGAELPSGYCGDISSTFPIGSAFDSRQRAIYQVVHGAHFAAVDMLEPGVPFRDVHFKACKTIAEGMKSLGMMKGDMDEAVRLGAHALFFQCGLGHSMGLDVHDMESLGEFWVGYDGVPKSTLFGWKSLRLARPLEPGFVLTIEPGIYFIPSLIDLWKSEKRFADFIDYDEVEKWRDAGGFRNEEDYLITSDGHRRLGEPGMKPIDIDSVEAFRKAVLA